ncbi:MAG: anthranilate phosphoribosyltransferase [Myxococcales bacterium SG8_38_1]|nr:MAG: anthranilate phosphoribosyltransferase [Myxococcales bacterium SG8_38_1]
MIGEAIKAVVAGRDLSPSDVEDAMDAILSGEATPAQIAAFVVALRMKGESSDEIAAAARSLRKHCESIHPNVDGPLLDTCGTGGDGLHTFNISTASAIVAAACGVAVAKHGNRAVSSKAGSADVLEALGVRIDIPAESVRRCIEEVGIGFLFAPSHHAAMRHAAPIRRELGIRTLFNLLGPLSNPASATHQVVGVFDPARAEQLATALGILGLDAAWVVHGDGGLDEVSPSGPTRVAELRNGEVRTFELSPADFGVDSVSLEALRGGDANENADIIGRVLRGEACAARAAVVVNAAAALCVTGIAADPETGAKRAAEALDSGAAEQVLARWVQYTQAI